MRFKSSFADYVKEINKPPKLPKPQKVKGIRARFEICLDSISDADILEHLSKQSNKSDYIRQLVRKDIGTQ